MSGQLVTVKVFPRKVFSPSGTRRTWFKLVMLAEHPHIDRAHMSIANTVGLTHDFGQPEEVNVSER